jgi:hypothetical protein
MAFALIITAERLSFHTTTLQAMQLRASKDDLHFMELARGLLRYDRHERLSARKALQVCGGPPIASCVQRRGRGIAHQSTSQFIAS